MHYAKDRLVKPYPNGDPLASDRLRKLKTVIQRPEGLIPKGVRRRILRESPIPVLLFAGAGGLTGF